MMSWQGMAKTSVMMLGLLSSANILADSEPETLPADQGDAPVWWHSTHEVASQKVGTWSKSLDMFFSGQRHDNINDSFVSMRFGSIIEEQDGVSGFFNLDARIDLPSTEDRLDLIIESDADELTQDNRVTENDTGQNILQSAQDTRFATMLRYVADELDADIDLGVLVRMPLDPFVRMRLKQAWQTGDWYWQQQEAAFVYYSLGNGARYNIETTRELGERFAVGAEFGVTYLELESDTYWREDVYLTQRLSDKSSLRYQVSYLQAGSVPSADSFLYFAEYQRVLHKNWLIGEIKPQMTYEDDNDFEGEFSVSLSLEVLFGPNFL
ncbi:hypothetical protein [Marinomonas ostreistagni]|uniref:hypothetical protein n=1 Tax=Marinomonas ostreistagni TaxID=359209 RepID=UPI0019503CF6|nr:hypothetical protein [Marinomonas ostreistagni]MBM6550523.1 hypothetical protein [Marinomonas ostreistagni]